MKILFIFVVLVLSVHSKDEELPSLQELLNDPELMKMIKRLGITENDLTPKEKPAAVDKPESLASDVDLPKANQPTAAAPTTMKPEYIKDSVGNACYYKTHESTIIRSHESQKAGSLLLRWDGNKTRHECIKSCCYTQGCTLAVFEDKDNNTCYLFNCGENKCAFANHENYVSMTLRESSIVHGGSLGQDNEGDLKGLQKPEKPRPSPTPKPTPVQQKRPVPIFGECDVSLGDKCLDFNAECKQGICQCIRGFKADKGVCYFHRKENPEAPEGIHQAPEQGVTSGPVQTKTEKVTPAASPKVTQQPLIEKVDTVDTQPAAPEKPDTEKTKPETTEGTEKTETEHPPKTSKLADKQKPVTSNTSKSAVEVPSTEKATTKPRKEEKVEVKIGEEDGLVIVEAPNDSNQGPIVALALGLGVTMMLLVYVGCRLRNVKRRIRKGRALHSNEADYLINGMYL